MAQPSLLVGVRDNAAAMRAGGDLTGACEYLLRALDSARDAFGADEPEVLWTAHLLARLRREAGDPAAARRLLEESLAAGELRLGDREPVMLAIAYELATLAEELGNRHEARRNFSRVAAAGPAQLGDDHWQVRAARDRFDVGEGTRTDVSQAEARAALSPFESEGPRLKVNPLANWTAADLRAYMDAHDLPRHPLVAKGYPSIGCVPCTSRVKSGEDQRSGRWRGLDKTECGIHQPLETDGSGI